MKNVSSRTLSLSILLFLGGAACAQAQLVIDKGKVNLTVNPGQQISDTLTLTNSSDADLKVKIYMEDFAYTPPFEGSKEFYKAGTVEGSNSNWVTLSPREVTIPPKGKKQMSYVINVPPDAKGGYQGVIIFENLPFKVNSNPLLATTKPTAGMSFILRIGTLLFLKTPDAVFKPTLENFKFDADKLLFDVKNDGEAVLIPEAKYYVMDFDGNVVDRGDINKRYLPKGESINYGLEFKGLSSGQQYTLVLSMDFEFEPEDSLTREVDFRKTPEGIWEVLSVRE